MLIEQLRLPNEDEPPVAEAVLNCQDPDLFTRVDDITQVIRAAIQPIRLKAGRFDMQKELLSSTPRANCYGSNLILSEALEISAIPHVIVFANDHIFNMVTDRSTFGYMADGHTPEFNADMTAAMPKRQLQAIGKSLLINNRALIEIDASVVAKNSKINKSLSSIYRLNPWLSHNSSDLAIYNMLNNGYQASQHNLIATAYDPSLGRLVISNRELLQRHIYNQETMLATQTLHSISGLYPEVDYRNTEKSQELGKLALALAQGGDILAAKQVVFDVSASYSISNHLKLKLWPADQLRKIGIATKKSDLIKESIEMYQALLLERPDNQLVIDKMNAAKKHLALLDN